jgi:Protein of unknown function (DUF3455)
VNLPTVPEQLRPPAGEQLVFTAHARGFQIYRWQNGADGKDAWVLKAPQADLLDDNSTVIGTHFAGPSWKLNDGSMVVGRFAAKADSPDRAAIPWLLLSVTQREGNGVLSQATSIQRIHTRGGQPPWATGKTAGEEVKVSYSADYYFYAPADT